MRWSGSLISGTIGVPVLGVVSVVSMSAGWVPGPKICTWCSPAITKLTVPPAFTRARAGRIRCRFGPPGEALGKRSSGGFVVHSPKVTVVVIGAVSGGCPWLGGAPPAVRCALATAGTAAATADPTPTFPTNSLLLIVALPGRLVVGPRPERPR